MPTPIPLQITLSVYTFMGDHIRLLGNFNTAQDGTFYLDLPPGTYVVEPDPSMGYVGIGQLEINVAPRQVTVDEIDVIGADDDGSLGLAPI